MDYANKYVIIRDAEHLDLVASVTGMKMTNLNRWSVTRRLGEEGLVIIFDENFDEDNSDWGFDDLPLSGQLPELEQLHIRGQ